MSMNALTKAFSVGLMAIGFVPAMFAGPEPLPDRSKDKEVQMVQQPPVCDPRWYFSIGGGIDVDLDGPNLNNGFLHDFRAGTPGGFFPARVDSKSRDWSDGYDDAWRVQGEIGYALTQHLEVFGLFKYAQADASGRVTGSHLIVDARPFVFSDFPTSIAFDGDYSSYGGELGFRFFFLPKEARVRPYVSFSGGATHVDGIGATIFVDASEFGGPSDLEIYRGGFFNDSWVGTASALLGVEVNLACHWAVGVNGGVRYQSRLEQDDRDFDGLRIIPGGAPAAISLRAFKQVNDDAGDRWAVPVTGYVKFRF